MKVSRWGRDYPPTVNEAKLELQEEGITSYRFDLRPDQCYPPHSHAHTEIRVVISGTMAIGETGTEGFLLCPGDRAEIPPGAEHWMRVVGDEEVVAVSGEREE